MAVNLLVRLAGPRGVSPPAGPFLLSSNTYILAPNNCLSSAFIVYFNKFDGGSIVLLMEVDGVKLKEERLNRGLSQMELHELSGVSQDTISKMETGDRPNPHPRTLRKLAEALGVSVADIRKRG
jgi:DNA-binding XRE family transcriptional regulator